ncbi:hypothetical protein LCGC14_1823300 [marine sediment metagenome]|uniref:Uncharacterized protein n=1 Tax=marine sediment metagenome TaxID=412755 RepID=A0A0F9H6F7_9ZZZZ
MTGDGFKPPFGQTFVPIPIVSRIITEPMTLRVLAPRYYSLDVTLGYKTQYKPIVGRMVYIDVPLSIIMNQKLESQSPLLQEVDVEKSIGNLFEEFLTKKNRLAEFDNWAGRTLVSIDGEILRLSARGFPAKVSQILKLVIKPTQELKFFPALAGG